MQALFSRRILLQLTALVCGFALMACQAGAGGGTADGGNKWQGQTVYSRVGMKVEANKKGEGWHMYSTNHIGLPKHLTAGTKFTARSVGRSQIELVGEDGSVIHVDYVVKHHPGMDFNAWLERQLSLTPVELPGNLDEKERAAIHEGRYEVGMTRAALFLSIGYPPAALSPTLTDSTLKYEVKRFDNIYFTFDAQDRIAAIKN